MSHTSFLPRSTYTIFIHYSFTTPPTTEIYTLSLHDALPILCCKNGPNRFFPTYLDRKNNSKLFIIRRLTFQRKIIRSEEHTSELQSRGQLVCRLLLEKKKISDIYI